MRRWVAGDEFDEPDFAATGTDGKPVIAEHAHVRLAHPDRNGGARLLRRGYNFVDGSDGLGRLDAGLFFIAYQRDPRRQFVPIQTQLARHDVMNEYLRHVSSGAVRLPARGTPTAATTGAGPLRLTCVRMVTAESARAAVAPGGAEGTGSHSVPQA